MIKSSLSIKIIAFFNLFHSLSLQHKKKKTNNVGKIFDNMCSRFYLFILSVSHLLPHLISSNHLHITSRYMRHLLSLPHYQHNTCITSHHVSHFNLSAPHRWPFTSLYHLPHLTCLPHFTCLIHLYYSYMSNSFVLLISQYTCHTPASLMCL